MTHDLDTRARSAAVALHDSVREVSAPTALVPRRQPTLALAVATIVAIVAVAVALRSEGTNDTDVVTDDAGNVPRFILDEPPAGTVPTGAVDLPIAGAGGVTQTYWVYGDPEADNPFAEGDLGVVISRGPDVEFVPPDDSREVEVDGRSAFVAASNDPLEPRSVTLELDDGSVGYVASRSLSDDELLDAVDDLELTTGTVDELGGLGRLELVATSTAGATGTIPLPLPASSGHIAGYQSEDEFAATTVVVASVAGGEDAYLVARWALGPTSRSITIRGTEGWVGAPYGDDSTILVWRESPTNLVALSAFGLDEGAALAAAESLEVAGDDVWDQLLTDTGQVRVPSGAQAGVSGAVGDGASYAAYLDGDGSLCLDVETEDGSEGACGGVSTSEQLVVQVGDLGDGTIVVYGYTTLGTNGEVRITADGASAGSEAYHDEGTVFAFAVPADQVPQEIVVRAADGTELGRAAVPAVGSAAVEGTATTMSG